MPFIQIIKEMEIEEILFIQNYLINYLFTY